MKEEKDCKIVQDLLPNYIEGLANEATKDFFEEHLNKCNECKQIFENMQEDLKVNIIDKDKKAVKYFKKYRNKLRFLWIILLVILVIFVGNTARKMIILSNLANKSKAYTNSENYHYTSYIYLKNKIIIDETWNLGDKRKFVSTHISPEGTTKFLVYGNKTGTDEWGNELYDTNTYNVTENNKTVELNVNKAISGLSQSMTNVLIEDFYNLLLISLRASVTSTTYNGEECYYIQSLPYLLSTYVSKNTGLSISILTQEVENANGGIDRLPISEYTYEFNTVTEDDFIELDISEYNVK